jgi:hypothetical protein
MDIIDNIVINPEIKKTILGLNVNANDIILNIIYIFIYLYKNKVLIDKNLELFFTYLIYRYNNILYLQPIIAHYFIKIIFKVPHIHGTLYKSLLTKSLYLHWNMMLNKPNIPDIIIIPKNNDMLNLSLIGSNFRKYVKSVHPFISSKESRTRFNKISSETPYHKIKLVDVDFDYDNMENERYINNFLWSSHLMYRMILNSYDCCFMGVISIIVDEYKGAGDSYFKSKISTEIGSSLLNHDKVNNTLAKNKCIVVMIGIHIPNNGHANVVIINPRNKTISMYEPHGSDGIFVNLMYGKQRTRIVCAIYKCIKESQNGNKNGNIFDDYMLLTPKFVNFEKDIQSKSNIRQVPVGGLCEQYSRYMGLLSAMNPDVSIKMLSVYLSIDIQVYSDKKKDKHCLRRFINFKNFLIILGFITKYFIPPKVFEKILNGKGHVTDPLNLMNVIILFLIIPALILIKTDPTKAVSQKNKDLIEHIDLDQLKRNITNLIDVKNKCMYVKSILKPITVEYLNGIFLDIGVTFAKYDIDNFIKFVNKKI